MKVLTILGTRPEAIKLAPVLLALGAEPAVEQVICVTAQHRSLLDQTLAQFGIRPDVDLDLMVPNQGLAAFAARALQATADVVAAERPDWVMVQGDTTTVLAGALAAFYAGVRVAHVEAGLRSGDLQRPFPEEMNRRVTSIVGALHFAPTPTSAANLLREGVPASGVLVTGNPVIDALFHVRARLRPEQVARWRHAGRRTILLTCHRRENFGAPLRRIFEAVLAVLAEVPDAHVVYPVHPNPNVRDVAHAMLGGHARVELLEPLDYVDLVAALDAATLVITDSGGIQEEAPSLGKPVLVVRDVTERPEAVAAGTVRLVGGDGATLHREAVRLMTSEAARAEMARAHNPYGDGHASARIVDALLGRPVEPFAGGAVALAAATT